MKLNLYRLLRLDEGSYDEFAGFIIAASSPEVARACAAHNKGGESAAVWTNPARSACDLIGTLVRTPLPEYADAETMHRLAKPGGPADAFIVMGDFRAG